MGRSVESLDAVKRFGAESEAAGSLRGLGTLMFEACAALGFPYAGLIPHIDPARAGVPVALIHNFPDAFARRFAAEDGWRRNPVLRHVERSGAPFGWGDDAFLEHLTAKDRRVLAAAFADGVYNGYTIPLALDALPPMSFSVAGAAVGLDLYARAAITTIASQAHRCANLILARRRGATHIRRLTRRERQCVALTAYGVDDDAIARALGVAPVTVRANLASGRRRLGARSRTHAVYRAIASGEFQ